MAEGETDRCVTGIRGLDRILGGGFPLANLILVKGECGTGKTTLALEFLVRGVEAGERGLLVSTVEWDRKLLSNVPRFEFLREDYLEGGQLEIVELTELLESAGLMDRAIREEEVMQLCDSLEKKIAEGGFRRFVMDSLTPLHYEVGNERIVHHMLRRLSQILYRNACTGVLVSEEGPLCKIEGIVADGVIEMGNMDRSGDLLRTLQIVKMKGTEHSRGKYVIDLTSMGVLVTPLLKGGGR